MSRQWETPRGAPRTVPSSSGKRNTVLIATLTERGFFSFVEATSRFLGSYEKALASFSSFWNVIRLPVTRSVGLKGQGGPGVSETRGGACDVIVRRHEAPPRVTERPSATLRLRHPVPALPPFGSTDAGYSSDADDCASSCRESDERFVSAVQTANRRCVHKRGSVWPLSPVGLVDHSDPTTARQLRTGVTGGSYSVSIPSAVIGVRSAVGFVASRERPMYGASARHQPTCKRPSAPNLRVPVGLTWWRVG